MKKVLIAVVVMVFFCIVNKANATVVTYDLDVWYGDVTPVYAGPYASITLDDENGDGVDFTLKNLTPPEGSKLFKFYFNYNGALALDLDDGIEYTPDGYKAGSVGEFDLRIVYAEEDRINFGEEDSFAIYPDEDGELTVADFYDLNAVKVGKVFVPGDYHFAAHLGGVEGRGGDSIWVADSSTPTVPEPATMSLLGLGLMGLAGLKKRRV